MKLNDLYLLMISLNLNIFLCFISQMEFLRQYFWIILLLAIILVSLVIVLIFIFINICIKTRGK